MKFRLRAFSLHLLASFTVLTALLGTFYLCWYRWPGWYLANVSQVSLVLAGVDLVLGPMLTLVIASAAKPRRLLVRDITVIAFVQLCALGYGTLSLWNGRPLYYAFSQDALTLVQRYDIDAAATDAAAVDPAVPGDALLQPHWYSLPRWIWAPLPTNPAEHAHLAKNAESGGADVTALPNYYKRWEAGLPTLRTALKPVAVIKYFSGRERKVLAARMQAAGIAVDQANSIPFTGRSRPLLAVFDPTTLAILGIFKAT